MISFLVIPVDTMIQESLMANQNLVMYDGLVKVLIIVASVIGLNVILALIGKYVLK